jgi:transposase-like protein
MDGGVWYPKACRWARLKHQHVYDQGRKNLIERMNRSLKDRIENFDDLFPCFKEDCDLEHVDDWIRVSRLTTTT